MALIGLTSQWLIRIKSTFVVQSLIQNSERSLKADNSEVLTSFTCDVDVGSF